MAQKKIKMNRFFTSHFQLISLTSNTVLNGNTKIRNIMKSNRKRNKGNFVPIHAERHIWGWHVQLHSFLTLEWVGCKCQFHVLADLHLGKEPLATTEKKAAWAPQPVWTIWTTEIYLALPKSETGSFRSYKHIFKNITNRNAMFLNCTVKLSKYTGIFSICF